MKRKAKVLELLEQGPATTGDVRRMCDCANGAQAYGTLEWLEKCGVVIRERVPRNHANGGPSTTTQWRLANAA